MMTKKPFYNRLKERGALVFRRFPISILFIAVATLFTLLSIQMDQTTFTREAVSAGLAALLFATGHLAVEGFLANRKKHQLPLFVGLFILSLLYYLYLRQTDLLTNQISLIRTFVLYFILTVTFIAVPTVRSPYTFPGTLVAFIKSIFSSLLIAVVFYVGVASILGTFSTLFTPLSFEWFAHAAALIFVFFAPIYFLSGTPFYIEEREPGTVNEATLKPTLLSVLIDYIIVPLLLVFSVLLIAYIGINITGEFWLDNLIEPMLISYVSAGFIALFLTEHSTKSWVTLFNHYFPYLLLIIAVFQSISSSIKSFELGLTHGRYYVLLFGIFAISGVLIYGFFKTFRKVIPFILVALGIISILPLVDAVSIGIASQLRQVDNVIDQNQLDENGRISSDVEFSHEEMIQLSYSFNYLEQTNALDRIDWLPENFNYYNQFQTVFGFDPYYYSNFDTEYPGQVPVEQDYAYVELDKDTPILLPVTDFDDIVFFSTYQITDSSGENTVELNQPGTQLVITADDTVIGLELVENDEMLMNFDLSFLKDEVFVLYETSQFLTLEELTFTEENDEVEVSVIVNRFESSSSANSEGEFTVLINYK